MTLFSESSPPPPPLSNEGDITIALITPAQASLHSRFSVTCWGCRDERGRWPHCSKRAYCLEEKIGVNLLEVQTFTGNLESAVKGRFGGNENMSQGSYLVCKARETSLKKEGFKLWT